MHISVDEGAEPEPDPKPRLTGIRKMQGVTRALIESERSLKATATHAPSTDGEIQKKGRVNINEGWMVRHCLSFRCCTGEEAVAVFTQLLVYLRPQIGRQVDVLDHLDRRYGGPLGYLNLIGFDQAWRSQLKATCGANFLGPSTTPQARLAASTTVQETQPSLPAVATPSVSMSGLDYARTAAALAIACLVPVIVVVLVAR
jgi:hypothetical protein